MRMNTYKYDNNNPFSPGILKKAKKQEFSNCINLQNANLALVASTGYGEADVQGMVSCGSHLSMYCTLIFYSFA